jgi:hypothetical protein
MNCRSDGAEEIIISLPWLFLFVINVLAFNISFQGAKPIILRLFLNILLRPILKHNVRLDLNLTLLK